MAAVRSQTNSQRLTTSSQEEAEIQEISQVPTFGCSVQAGTVLTPQLAS